MMADWGMLRDAYTDAMRLQREYAPTEKSEETLRGLIRRVNGINGKYEDAFVNAMTDSIRLWYQREKRRDADFWSGAYARMWGFHRDRLKGMDWESSILAARDLNRELACPHVGRVLVEVMIDLEARHGLGEAGK